MRMYITKALLILGLVAAPMFAQSGGSDAAGEGDNAVDGTGEAMSGGESPQAVFDLMVAAERDDDYALIFDCIHPARRTLVLAERLMVAAGMADGDEERQAALVALLEPYDVTLPEPNDEGVTTHEAYQAAITDVEDKSGLYVTLNTWIAAQIVDATEPDGSWSLTGVERDGNVARGTVVVTSESGDEQSWPIVFRRHESRWYVDPYTE